jgi:CheY-like chemotaxis protein
MGKRVLIVADNATNLRVLSEYLTAFGCVIDQASSADEAKQRLGAASDASRAYDIVVLDMMMPVVDGLTLGREIRRSGEYGAPKLVMLSSRDQRGDGRALEQAGFDAFFTKPVKRNVLHRLLVRLFERPGELAAAAATPAEAPETGLPLRVLVAEDNPTNQKVALSMLKRLGYRADAVANGREALKGLQLVPYDLVLMDVQMPDMDGLEATRRFRALEVGTSRRLPIIAMTAHASTADRDRCLEAGMDDFVTKPVQRDTLGRTLAAFLLADNPQQPGAAPQTPAARTADHGLEAPAADALPPVTTSAVAALAVERVPEPAGKPVPPAPAEPGPVPDAVADAHFSIAAMVERLDNDEEIAREIAGIFVENSKGLYAELADAIPAGDAEAVRTRAHSLKGSAGNIGAEALQQLAADMERAGRDGRLDEAERLLPQLAADLDAVNLTLDEWYAGAVQPG